MSYAALEEKIRLIPENRLDEVNDYLEFLLYKINSSKKRNEVSDLNNHFGTLKFNRDGLEIQRSMRDEWD